MQLAEFSPITDVKIVSQKERCPAGYFMVNIYAVLFLELNPWQLIQELSAMHLLKVVTGNVINYISLNI